MNITFLLQLFGPLFIAIGIGFIFSRNFYAKILDDFAGNSALVYITGIFTFLFGGFIVANANVWELSAVGLLTLLGWSALIKGVLLLAAPAHFLRVATSIYKNKSAFTFAGVLVLAIGFYLTRAGFFAG